VSAPRTNVVGNIYLLHFSKPHLHAGHYLGWTEGPVEVRVERHKACHGSPLVAAAIRNGSEIILARSWSNVTRAEEKRLKEVGGLRRQCPICKEAAKTAKLLKTIAWG
jgi:hypothetical protein